MDTWANISPCSCRSFWRSQWGTSRSFPLRVLLSQKERVGGAGGLRPSLGGHAHQWLRQWHGRWDPSTHTYASHSWHSTAHRGHPCQGDHGDGLSGHGGQGQWLCDAAEARGHRANAHLVEGRRNRLGHLEWICDGSWSWSGGALKGREESMRTAEEKNKIKSPTDVCFRRFSVFRVIIPLKFFTFLHF